MAICMVTLPGAGGVKGTLVDVEGGTLLGTGTVLGGEVVGVKGLGVGDEGGEVDGAGEDEGGAALVVGGAEVAGEGVLVVGGDWVVVGGAGVVAGGAEVLGGGVTEVDGAAVVVGGADDVGGGDVVACIMRAHAMSSVTQRAPRAGTSRHYCAPSEVKSVYKRSTDAHAACC